MASKLQGLAVLVLAGSWIGVAGPGHAPTDQVVLDLLAHAVIPDR
jgi:hypothetical protein